MVPGDHFWWGWGWWMLIPMAIPILFWAFLIAVFIWVVRRWKGKPSWPKYPGQEPESALDILKKRYARGEITKDEFERMKRDILS